jgi:hypothetical protein
LIDMGFTRVCGHGGPYERGARDRFGQIVQVGLGGVVNGAQTAAPVVRRRRAR